VASIGHIAVGMAAARVYRRGRPARWTLFTSMVVWSFVSLLPDADVIGFRFGIEYADPWGHRGATHSFAFSVGLAVVLGLLAGALRLGALRTTVVSALVLASHAVLDTLTDGGLGCALFWPLDDQRYFAPWNPIPVAPIGRRFFSTDGLSVAMTELVFFAPVFLYALWPRRKGTAETNASESAAQQRDATDKPLRR
jgi:inner membrane protein